MEIEDMKTIEALNEELAPIRAKLEEIKKQKLTEVKQSIWGGFQNYFREKGFEVVVGRGITASIGNSKIVLHSQQSESSPFAISVMVEPINERYDLKVIRIPIVKSVRIGICESTKNRLKQEIESLENEIKDKKKEIQRCNDFRFIFVLESNESDKKGSPIEFDDLYKAFDYIMQL
ncbi:MAG TPA: hypothetical protein ENN07_08325 [candidate division Zixibacteria bacterium]|nr:hypothetical protein [candidate division Zixibacteria bacterium]